ncbi:hypothetical protein P7C70_g9307, partial [Phenoliferia sp. Uapishka_3]
MSIRAPRTFANRLVRPTIAVRPRPRPQPHLRLASSYYPTPPPPQKGIKLGHLFIALAAVGLTATSIGLYNFYSTFTAFPNTSTHPIRTLLRRALTASQTGDSSRSSEAFAKAYELALDLASTGSLGSREEALLKTTGVAIKWGGMWEAVGQISRAREAYELAWREVVDATDEKEGKNGTEKEVMRGVAVALKIGDLWVEENRDTEAESYYVWAVQEMMRLGLSGGQKEKVREEMMHDAVPGKVKEGK